MKPGAQLITDGRAAAPCEQRVEQVDDLIGMLAVTTTR
jgi:hypothetical protein